MIEVKALRKRYRSTLAVDDLTFTVRPGAVTGFLGPNGAGKSTTMRMILGLDRPCAGEALIAGRRYAQLEHPLRTVGALLDAGWVHPRRSARAHLRWLARSNGLPAGRVAEVLGTVGLTAVADQPARTFSLGMRQRLGIATALIGDPQVLILDEPANGLDPAGIRWMRDLLRGYADRGATVLLSSHLLHEIEVIADDIVVIGHGRIVARGTKSDLLAGAGTLVKARDSVQLAAALAAAGVTFTDHGTPGGGDATALHVDADPELVGRVAHRADVPLVELRTADGAGLEEMFLELTANTQREGAAA
jgi:ABC-2 type transport system ATP-binding protein